MCRLRDTWSFVVAIAISIVGALLLAFAAVYFCFSSLLPRLKKEQTDAVVMRAASHRLDHELPC